MPYPLFKRFREACRDHPDSVHLEYDAEHGVSQGEDRGDGAQKMCKLNSKKEILSFFGDHGLERVIPLDPDDPHKIWRKNKDRDTTLYVTAYSCFVGRRKVYLAIIYVDFWFGQTRNTWKVKSFKPFEQNKMRQIPSTSLISHG
jgi:hypothetical protein